MNADQAHEERKTGHLPLIWLALLLLVALVPMPLGSNRPWASSALALWSSLLLGAWAIMLVVRPGPLAWRKALWLPTIFFAVVVGWVLITILPAGEFAHPVWQIASEALGRPLQGRIALSVDAVLISLARLIAYGAVFWLSLQYCRDRSRADALLAWVSWVGLALALYGLINFFAGNPYLLWFERWAGQGDVTATFVNRNHYATYAGLTLLCSTAVAVSAFRAAWRVSDRSQRLLARIIECLVGKPLVYVIISLVIAMAWLQTHSRMGAAAVLIGLAIMLILIMAARLVRGRLVPWLIGLILLLFVVQVSGEVTLARISATTQEIDRIPLFSLVVEQIAAAPYTGSGYGSFAQSFSMFRDVRLPAPVTFSQAHNSYLELAAEIGIPATALLVLAMLLCAMLCLIAVFRRQRGQIYPIVAVSASTIVAVHALVDFSLQIPAVAVLFAALLGMGVAQSWSSDPAPRRTAT